MGDYNITESILVFLSEATNLLPMPLETPYAWTKRVRGLSNRRYYDSVRGLNKRGIVKTIKKEGKIFIELTEKGVLETLLLKAAMDKQKKWDGKWRLCIFDIPEEAHAQRDKLRRLLKQQGFRKLQASVFIHPFALNRHAISYLRETGLERYIRFLKVEEMDNDENLKKVFNLV